MLAEKYFSGACLQEQVQEHRGSPSVLYLPSKEGFDLSLADVLAPIELGSVPVVLIAIAETVRRIERVCVHGGAGAGGYGCASQCGKR
jgi:hypothetical protein